jgi:NAD(P)-dependent dehydrogenase (short-subunit alcohol dehydrogenase family)
MPDAEVALVCGAGGALGSALVAAFSARGDRVVAVDRAAPDAAAGVRAEAADLTSADDVEALWSRLEADGLRPRWVANAVGGFRTGTVADSDPDSLRLMLDLNLGTAWWSCRSAARRLEDGGAIVNVSARAALTGGSGSAAYAVAKAAVVRLTHALALELADRGVRANVLLPSVIDTPANRASTPPEQMAKAVPPAEIAAVAAFLCSDASAPISGAAIPVYGRA